MGQTPPPTHVLREPKAVRGFLYWAVLIAGIVLWVLFSKPIEHTRVRDLPTSWLRQQIVIIASGSAISKALFLLGGCLTIGLCIVWYLLTRKRTRCKSLISRFFGSVLFGLGSYVFFVNSWTPANLEFYAKVQIGLPELFALFLMGLISAGLLVASYFLYFTRFSSLPSTSYRRPPPACPPEYRAY